MIQPVVYIYNGKAVLKEGEHKVCELAEGDPVEVVRSLCLLGEVVVIDLDAEKETGVDNKAIIKEMLSFARIKLGGGMFTSNYGLDWLDIGVTKIIVSGGCELSDFLSYFPKERVCVGVDMSKEEAISTITTLSAVCDEFLLTTTALNESTTQQLDQLKTTMKEKSLETNFFVDCNSGDVKHIQTLNSMGMKCQVGDALLSNTLTLGDVVVSFAKSDRSDGLYTTVVVDEQGVALGLVYSDDASIRAACGRRKGIYHSRKRGLWEKGLTSGATQDLLAVALDCDGDALLYTVQQNGVGFCHLERRTCWSGDKGVGHLLRTLDDRKKHPVKGSYTNRLLDDPTLLHNKLLEEAQELIEAKTKEEVAAECADVVYFASVILARSGVQWKDVDSFLDRRSLRVRRRPGNAHLDRTPNVQTKTKKQKVQHDST